MKAKTLALVFAATVSMFAGEAQAQVQGVLNGQNYLLPVNSLQFAITSINITSTTKIDYTTTLLQNALSQDLQNVKLNAFRVGLFYTGVGQVNYPSLNWYFLDTVVTKNIDGSGSYAAPAGNETAAGVTVAGFNVRFEQPSGTNPLDYSLQAISN